MDIQEPLNRAFVRAGITASDTPELDRKKGLTALLSSVPSRAVILACGVSDMRTERLDGSRTT